MVNLKDREEGSFLWMSYCEGPWVKVELVRKYVREHGTMDFDLWDKIRNETFFLYSLDNGDYSGFNFDACLVKVLSLPAVASKQFLITIGDRSVGGLTVQDQFIGPWQVPIADCAITANDFSFKDGIAQFVV